EGGERLSEIEFHPLPFWVSRFHALALRREKKRQPTGHSLDQRRPQNVQRKSRREEHLLRARQHLRPNLRLRARSLHAHARPNASGPQRRRADSLGHRLNLGWQSAKPNRQVAPLEN